jgi:hypothetical protein
VTFCGEKTVALMLRTLPPKMKRLPVSSPMTRTSSGKSASSSEKETRSPPPRGSYSMPGLELRKPLRVGNYLAVGAPQRARPERAGAASPRGGGRRPRREAAPASAAAHWLRGRDGSGRLRLRMRVGAREREHRVAQQQGRLEDVGSHLRLAPLSTSRLAGRADVLPGTGRARRGRGPRRPPTCRRAGDGVADDDRRRASVTPDHDDARAHHGAHGDERPSHERPVVDRWFRLLSLAAHLML